MRDLDATDFEILRLLTENARRPYSDIADEVGLSAPAVSDRITRLQELGVIRRFTLDVDQSQIRSGVTVLVDLALDPTVLDEVHATLREAEEVEHIFTTAASHLVVSVRVPDGAVREWLSDHVDFAHLDEYEVTLLTGTDWAPSVGGNEFTLTCVECGNTVSSEGVITRIDGTLYKFCCSSCEGRFKEQFDRLQAGAEAES